MLGTLRATREFQSTPSARRATASSTPILRGAINFNPRPPRGGRHKIILDTLTIAKFQSTPSARRATCDSGLLCFAILDFNPRPPRGERLIGVVRCSPAYMISIHALREESDPAAA